MVVEQLTSCEAAHDHRLGLYIKTLTTVQSSHDIFSIISQRLQFDSMKHIVNVSATLSNIVADTDVSLRVCLVGDFPEYLRITVREFCFVTGEKRPLQ